MSIHHATRKKAEKYDVEIVDQEDNAEPERRFAATPNIDGNQRTFMHSDPKVAVQAAILARQLHLEYPALWLDQTRDVNARFRLFHEDHDDIVLETGEVPSLQDCLDAAIEAGVDPESNDADDAEQASGGTVVSQRYRDMYKERGNPDHCGDWLATQLDGAFHHSIDGQLRFDVDAFIEFLRNNAVDMTGRWAQLPTANTPGWQGRFRMNGRQRLEKVVAHRGTIWLPSSGWTDVPEDELQRLRKKHPEPKKNRKAQTQDAQQAEAA